jgi:hypothetical protein
MTECDFYRNDGSRSPGGTGTSKAGFTLPLALYCTFLRVKLTEYTECWPCPLFDILLNKYFPAG